MPSSSWTAKSPAVLQGSNLHDFLESLINSHGQPSHLIICSTKQVFFERLYASLAESIEPVSQNEGTSDYPIDISTQAPNATLPPDPIDIVSHRLLTPTLHLLSSTRSLKTFFCPDVQHTLAQLASLQATASAKAGYMFNDSKENKLVPLLVVLDPISQHRDTLSWSAQGLTRFFSTAVAAAKTIGAKLVIADFGSGDVHTSHGGREVDDSDAFENTNATIWDEEISMLNVTTKTFGVGEQGWQGRTVSVSRIAQRWCQITHLDNAGT